MKHLLTLKDYRMTRLHVEYLPKGNPTPRLQENPQFTFAAGANPANPLERALNLHVRAVIHEPVGGNCVSIEAVLFGVFEFKSEAAEKEMTYLLFLNGSIILYGLLRGALLSAGAHFPGERLLLPSVYFDEILKREAEKQVRASGDNDADNAAGKKNDAESQPKAPASRPAARRAPRKMKSKSTGKKAN